MMHDSNHLTWAEVEEGGRDDRSVLYRLIELQIKLPGHRMFTASQDLYRDIGRTDHRHGLYLGLSANGA